MAELDFGEGFKRYEHRERRSLFSPFVVCPFTKFVRVERFTFWAKSCEIVGWRNPQPWLPRGRNAYPGGRGGRP